MDSSAAWDPQLQHLLSLKRHEVPSEDYFEDFLAEFQRRQRLEAMRPNLWELWKEKISDFVDHVRVPSTAYATAGLMALGATVWIFTSEEIAVNSPSVAAVPEQPALRMELHSPPPSALPIPVTIPSQRMVGTLPPRYLLDNRPTAEADPFSF